MNLLLVIVIQASFYALLGMGYVLIYRATRVLNLAHGDLMVFGAFLFFQALGGLEWQSAALRHCWPGRRGGAGRTDLPRDHAPAGRLSGRCGRAGHDRARHPAALHRDVDLVGADAISGRISRAARAADRNHAGLEHQRDRYRDHRGRARCDGGISVVAAAGRDRRGDAGRGREPAAGGAARHQYSSASTPCHGLPPP